MADDLANDPAVNQLDVYQHSDILLRQSGLRREVVLDFDGVDERVDSGGDVGRRYRKTLSRIERVPAGVQGLPFTSMGAPVES